MRTARRTIDGLGQGRDLPSDAAWLTTLSVIQGREVSDYELEGEEDDQPDEMTADTGDGGPPDAADGGPPDGEDGSERRGQ